MAHATGDIVAYLNSDDIYMAGAFAAVVDFFRAHADCEWLCGDTLMFGEEGEPTSLVVADVPESAGPQFSGTPKGRAGGSRFQE